MCLPVVHPTADSARSIYMRDCFAGHGDYTFTYLDAHVFRLNATAGTRLGHVMPSASGTRPPDNRTACQLNPGGRVQVCLSVCSGDFCNGPKYQAAPLGDTSGDGGARLVGGVWVLLPPLLLLMGLVG